MIAKVIFFGDPYRGEQAANITKTKDLFSPVLEKFGVTAEALITDHNINSDRDRWVPFWRNTLRGYPRPILADVDLEGSAVIGFEVPDAELEFLSSCSIPWINLCIHPIRFLDDLHFEVTASFGLDDLQLVTSRSVVDYCAKKIISSCDVQSTRSPVSKTLLICAQVWFDRSVYFDGDFKRLDDYLNSLDCLASRYDRVLYKPHPSYCSLEIANLLRDRYEAEEVVNHSVYDLFASGEVQAVAAISSSVLTEAPFFDVTSEYLEPRAKRYGSPVSYNSLLNQPMLWERLLQIPCLVEEKFPLPSRPPNNFVRDHFGSWGFVTQERRLEQKLNDVELNLRQSDLQKQEQRQRAEAAEAQTQEQRQRAEAAEAQTQEQRQRAEVAEAQMQEQRQRAEALEAQLQRLQVRVDELKESSHHWWMQSSQYEGECGAMRKSLSWRITAPLRVIGRALRWSSSYEEMLNALFSLMLSAFKRGVVSVVTTGAEYAQESPRFRSYALRVLQRMPGVLVKLRQIYIGSQSGAGASYVDSGVGTTLISEMQSANRQNSTTVRPDQAQSKDGINSAQRSPLEAQFHTYVSWE